MTKPKRDAASASLAAAASAAPDAKVPKVSASAMTKLGEEFEKRKSVWPAQPDPAKPVEMPELPADDSDICARDVMKKVIAWVVQELPKLQTNGAEKNVLLRAPLDIEASKDDKTKMTSYKEKWVKTNCVKSILQSKVYEAGGSALWLNPEVWDDDFFIPAPEPSWSWVIKCAKQNFKPFVGGSTGDRVMFPVTLSAAWYKDANTLSDSYPCGAIPLGGHGFLWGWFVAVFLALREDAKHRVDMLLEAALTATITLYGNSEKSALVLHAMHYSEIVRHSTHVLVDSFITFAQKVHAWSPKVDVEMLRRSDVRFNGSLAGVTHLKCINHLKQLSSEAIAVIGMIDRMFGFDVLSGNYNKLLRLMQGTAGKVANHQDLVLWSVQLMYVVLKRGECTESDFKVDHFCKAKDGTPSWIAQGLVQRTFLQHMQTVIENTRAVDAHLANLLTTEVLEKFADPIIYDATFPCQTKDVTDGDGDGTAAGSEDKGFVYMKNLEDKLPKAGPLLAEICKKIYDGTYDDIYSKFAGEEANELDQSLATNSTKLEQFGKDVDELLKALHTAQSVVGTSEGSAPKPSLRDLVRQKSDPEGRSAEDILKQRSGIWKKAVAQRKKLVQLGFVSNPKDVKSYAEVFRKAGPTQSWKAKAKEEHRVFSLSADLITDAGEKPWMTKTSPNEKVLQAGVEFLKLHRAGAADVMLAFDGCCRDSRSELGKLPNAQEMFFIFSSSWNAWAMRPHFLSSSNCELGYVHLPVSRNKITCKDRPEGFNAAGEQNSHFTSMTGISMTPRTKLPRISVEEKQKIFGKSGSLPDKWLKNIPAGCPLFWGETKSVSFWVQILTEMGAKCVVDLTPGSGALAEAAMTLGVQYFGFVTDHVHLGWLTNVVDRASCRQIVKTGSFLYQEDLAVSLKEMFSDIVGAGAEEEEEEEDPDDCVRASDDEAV